MTQGNVPEVKSWTVRLGGVYGAVLDGMEWSGKLLLTRLNVPRAYRRQGHGRALMEQACAWADAEGVRLLLTALPYPDSGWTKQSLAQWYASFGFEPVDGPVFLERSPRTAPPCG